MSETIEQVKSVMETAGVDNASVEKIMDKLIVIDKNLILKTDIENPMAFTALIVIAETLRLKGLKKSSKTLFKYIDTYIKVRISYKRYSRREILDAISAIKREVQNSITSKLLGMGDKEKR